MQSKKIDHLTPPPIAIKNDFKPDYDKIIEVARQLKPNFKSKNIEGKPSLKGAGFIKFSLYDHNQITYIIMGTAYIEKL